MAAVERLIANRAKYPPESAIISASNHTPCFFCPPRSDRVFLRDELVYALWDGYPVSPGHALLIPKRHVPTWFDATAEEQLALMRAVDTAKAIIEKHHRPDAYNIGMNCGAAAGQTVFHLHVHLIPRYAGDTPDPRGGVRNSIPGKGNYIPTDRLK
jgi:diadenosine tetraphosphate (Ap4A) HIT family hydrolase